MSTYHDIRRQVESLTADEQLKLLEDLAAIVRRRVTHPVEVEGSVDEIIPPEEIAESEAAWQDYLAGRDLGVSAAELKLKLFGEKVDNT